MKARLAQKIIKFRNGPRESYWQERWLDYEFFDMDLNSKRDHRIDKAIKINSRKNQYNP